MTGWPVDADALDAEQRRLAALTPPAWTPAARPLHDALAPLPTPGDVVLVDATGRDHPRGAGLALHLGAVLDVPTVGVTHRPLLARGALPPDELGASAPLTVDGAVVGAWLRTKAGVRPLAVHAAWRTDPEVAVEVVRRCGGGRTHARTASAGSRRGAHRTFVRRGPVPVMRRRVGYARGNGPCTFRRRQE
jgi:hypothetical protein